MVIALTYSPKESFTTMMSYIALGALGLPIYSGFNAGILYLTGPVGGYYLGMLMAAFMVPIYKEKYALSNLYACIITLFLIYIPGILWLSTFIGIEKSIFSGFLVYVPSGIVKTLMLVGILRFLKK
jgi:biotin transport system substrate-specific component